MSENRPSRSLEKIVVRLPDGMRDRLASKAKAASLTVNALVVRALERDLAVEHDTTTMLLRQKLSDTLREIHEAETRREMLGERYEDLVRSLDALGAFDVPPPDDDDEPLPA